jgi:anti-anti-sigma factor
VHEDICPVVWAGQQAVVTLPEHIDVSNAEQIREELLWVINRGATALIADMTATVSCDYAGADAVVHAYRRAVASGTQVRLVVTAQIVRRVLNANRLDRLVPAYPSLEAATAASTPVARAALVARTAWTGPHDQPPALRPGPEGAPFLAAGPPDGNAAGITPAMVWEILDALEDGVALADGDDVVTLANTRLAEMFGYDHAELLGRTVESLVSVGQQAANHGHRPGRTRAPSTRPMSAGERPAGLRKDGTTFPAKISHSPVATPAGHFTLTVIRDVTGARRHEDLADPASAAVTAELEHRRRELLDTVITRLFHVGLSLQATIGLPAEAARQRIPEALGRLDDTIREIRDSVLTARDHDTSPHPVPLENRIRAVTCGS